MTARQLAIGVCTFRRPGLAATLDSLERQIVPGDACLSILVADNDTTPSAEAQVRAFAARSRHRVSYLHAPARNIALARNAILEAARAGSVAGLAFIDDDETAPPHWLARLDRRLCDTGADAVIGPVRAEYGIGAPEWMRALRPHDTRPETEPDGRPLAGHSCNVLIDLTAPAFADLRFDPALGRSGGEDTAWFAAALAAGAQLALAEDAGVTEAVPPDRARLGWLLRRRYRMGQTHVDRSGAVAPVRAAKALAKACWCAGAALVVLPFASARNRNLLRGTLHLGVLSRLLGRPRIEIYGRDDQGAGDPRPVVPAATGGG